MDILKVDVTPETAAKWLAEWAYPYQRPVRTDKARFYADEMTKGNFLPGTTIRMVCENGVPYLVDGQHRLHAVILSGKNIEFVLIKIETHSQQETAAQYSNLDIGLARNFGDMFSAYGLVDELGLGKKQLNKLASAVLFILDEFSKRARKSVSREYLLHHVRAHADAAKQYFDLISGVPVAMKEPAIRSPTLSVATVTFRYSVDVYGDKVSEFWRGAIFDDELKIGDPRKTANRHLLTTGLLGGKIAYGYKQNYRSPSYSSRYLANCFRAFVEDRSLQFTMADETKPINILGSPFVSD